MLTNEKRQPERHCNSIKIRRLRHIDRFRDICVVGAAFLEIIIGRAGRFYGEMRDRQFPGKKRDCGRGFAADGELWI